MGNQAKAKEALAAMTAADQGGDPDTFFRQGVSLFNANNFAQAKTAFERVLAAEPNHPKAHYMMGLVYSNAGESAKAKEFLTKFVKLAPNDPDASAAKEMLEYLK
jgi:Flp pilus assembly protein TadD